MAISWRRMLPVVVYILIILGGSSIPTLAPPGPDFIPKDKIAHFVEYSILGALLFRTVAWGGVNGQRWVTFAFLVAVVATIAALDEIYQGFIPGRAMDVLDWLADVGGGAAGVAVVAFTPLHTKKLFLPAEMREREEA
jgi:VanZ family protein